MNWIEVLKSECRVEICDATSCLHNEERKCQLSVISVDEKGLCEQFWSKMAK